MPCRRTVRVDGLLRGPQGHAPRLQLMDDVLQVLDAAGEPVDARDHQRVARTKKLQQRRQLAPALQPRPAHFFGADHVAAGRSWLVRSWSMVETRA